MKQAKEIGIDSFNYNLPDDKIARYPLSQRDKSKLLIYNKGNIFTDSFNNVGKHLLKNSLLCYNNTKVVYARLFFKKQSGANIEVFCLEPVNPKSYDLIFSSSKTCEWKCIVGNLKKWKGKVLSKEILINNRTITLTAELISRMEQDVFIRFFWNSNDTFGDILEYNGNIPIPPYLKRNSEQIDKQRYQTLFADIKGSVAAPTAGLHFTENVFESLKNKDISIAPVTLHVSAGTFKPVKADTIGKHIMHNEHFSISKNALYMIKNNYGKITATGTTTMRTLESLYYIANRIYNRDFNFHIKQWEAYEKKIDIPAIEALNIILEYIDKENLQMINASTEIIIVPGFKFKFVNRLITNFHQPQSTLLLLVAAFIGQDWKQVYDYALHNDYRFLSYGDSSLLIPGL